MKIRSEKQDIDEGLDEVKHEIAIAALNRNEEDLMYVDPADKVTIGMINAQIAKDEREMMKKISGV